MKLIDKAALVAEINELKKEVGDDEYWNGYDIALDEVLYFIDILEMKEVQEEPVSKDYRERYKKIAQSDAFKSAYQNKSLGEVMSVKGKEPVIENLEEVISYLSKRYPEVSFAKLSRIAVYVAKWQQEKEYTCYEEAFEDGAKWKVENLWKPADGDDLPIIDREVIALLDNGKVVFAHRPNPNGWNGTNIDTGEEEHFEPEIYGKGGWNQPHVLYWLDAKLPYEENKIEKEIEL